MVAPLAPADRPFIDAHQIVVRATTAAVWDAAADTVVGWGGPAWALVARALGCSATRSDFPRTVVGFRVARAERPAVISLSGEHRFSSYALEFSTSELRDGQTLLRAQTWAEFPGLPGTLYRTLVIGTGGHEIAVRRLLTVIKRRAEGPERR